jgi:segregation and condensation protein B
MTNNDNDLRSAIEAILLVAGEPVSLERFCDVFGDDVRESCIAELDAIRAMLDEHSAGISLEQAAGGYRLITRPECDGYLRKFFSKQSEGRLSIAALETLAIVAYRQPITAPEVSGIRGVNSSGVIRTLLDRKLIKIAGRKNVVGTPFLYRTTKEFLLHFGLNSIQDLPRLEEFAEVLGEGLGEELLGSVSSEEGVILDLVAEGAEQGAETRGGEAESDGVRSSNSSDDAVAEASSAAASPEVPTSAESTGSSVDQSSDAKRDENEVE